MSIKILDCTLRDGGYVNNFAFGKENIIDIIKMLGKASIDIIECGFLKSNSFDENETLFGNIDIIKDFISPKFKHIMYVAMLQYGAISNDEIVPYDGTSIDGIRLTFHEHEIEDAFVLGKQLMAKGYKVFMQPVGTITYTDEALIELIKKINELKPFAFYIVDTLGTMYKNDLLRMFYLINHNLEKKIILGFHSHNNLQLSFANAQELIQINSTRELIIDSSIFGMGRGAGNLNTELVTQYLNTIFYPKYDNIEILKILDTYIKPLTLKYKWGYNAAYYVASIKKCHPNYASFLLNKQTLCIQDINIILNNLSPDKKSLFDSEYINQQYIHYMNHKIDDTLALQEIKETIGHKPILLIAPGKSISSFKEEIKKIIESKKYYIISINFIPEDIEVNMVFFSNIKRFANFKNTFNNFKVVLTSNIITNSQDNFLRINYFDYLNEDLNIIDNAGLMCINMICKMGIKEILLAGFDGFSENNVDNYLTNDLVFDLEKEKLFQINKAISSRISILKKQIQINFLATSRY